MNLRKFIIEIGMGIDQHGQDATEAAVKAVKDAVARPCLCGIRQILDMPDWSHVYVDVLIGCPHPEQVRKETVAATLPLGNVKVEVTEGGLLAHGVVVSSLGDRSDEMYIANAAVTVWVDVDQVRWPWPEGRG